MAHYHRIDVVSEGYVFDGKRVTEGLNAAVMPRAVLTSSGVLVVSAAITRGVGKNDYHGVFFRSADMGKTWQMVDPTSKWSSTWQSYAYYLSVSRGPNGTLLAYGAATPVTSPDEFVANEKTGGMLDNELVFSLSHDEGLNWTEPCVIPRPYDVPAEAPGPICATRVGRWVAPSSPWLNWEGKNPYAGRALAILSEDQGRTWPRHVHFLQDPDGPTHFQEQWIIELSDGRLLGTSWRRDWGAAKDYPNPYSLSYDSGLSFGPTLSTGLMGQSMGTRAWDDGQVICVYNRRYENPGVGLAIARPDDKEFHVEIDGMAWRAASGTRGELTDLGKGAEYLDFSFGEPAAEVLPDGSIYVVFWCIEAKAQGIRYSRVKVT